MFKSGEKVGYLTVLCKNGYRGNQTIYKCKCDCGNVVDVPASNLYSAIKKKYKPSCGCNTDQIRQISKKEALKNSKSGIRGVFFYKGVWYATIHFNGKTKTVRAKSIQDAAEKRRILEETYFHPIKEEFKNLVKEECDNESSR